MTGFSFKYKYQLPSFLMTTFHSFRLTHFVITSFWPGVSSLYHAEDIILSLSPWALVSVLYFYKFEWKLLTCIFVKNCIRGFLVYPWPLFTSAMLQIVKEKKSMSLHQKNHENDHWTPDTVSPTTPPVERRPTCSRPRRTSCWWNPPRKVCPPSCGTSGLVSKL